MFEAKLDGVDALALKLHELSEKITGLQHAIPDELVAWQREDMHRKFPNLTVEASGNETAASTEIWPHSRLEAQEEQARRQAMAQQRGPKQHRVARAAPAQHPLRRGPLPASNRPVLRDELMAKLRERMLALTAEAMKWP